MSTRRKPTKATASPAPVTEEPSEPAPAEAVAEEAPVEATPASDPAPATEPAPAAPEAPKLVCVTCGKRAVYETDGRATRKRAFCRRDLPANVTKAMVAEYELLNRQ